MIRPCTFGIEEEYLLVNLGSGQVPATPSPVVMGRCREALGRYFAQEMFRSQIELRRRCSPTCMKHVSFFPEQPSAAARGIGRRGDGAIRCGKPPLRRVAAAEARGTRHYKQLFDDYRHVARRSLLNGLHVHVACRQVVTACN